MPTVHFTLGEDLGKRLTEIAQEKLIYDADPDKAIGVFTQSLCGFPKDIAIRCLTGKDLKLVVTGDEIEVVSSPIDGYPELDLKYHIDQWTNEFKELYEIFERPLLNHTNFTKRSILIPYSVRDIILGYQDSNTDPYEYLREFIMNEAPYALEDDDDFEKGVNDIQLYRMFKEWESLFLKRAKVIQFALDNRLVEGTVVSPSYFINTIAEYKQKIWRSLYVGLKSPVEEQVELDRYLEASRKIEEMGRLEPLENFEKRDALWIAPDGTMYGLDGEIANMLHQQMAEMLLNQGVIKAEHKREENNPYSILEQNGWVKLHGNWVMFEPMSYDDKIKFMTDEQIDSLKKYLDKNYAMVGQFGVQHETVLTYKLNQMDKFAINRLFNI